MWYIANTASLREVAQIFDLSMSTVDGIVKDFSDELVQLSDRVSKIALSSIFTCKQFTCIFIMYFLPANILTSITHNEPKVKTFDLQSCVN